MGRIKGLVTVWSILEAPWSSIAGFISLIVRGRGGTHLLLQYYKTFSVYWNVENQNLSEFHISHV